MGVLFDRICLENGIEHLLTAVRSPTTTGKIERFHGTLRRERLAGGRTFGTLAQASRRSTRGWSSTTRPAAPVAGPLHPGRTVRCWSRGQRPSVGSDRPDRPPARR
jgi:transposase InsO family protein